MSDIIFANGVVFKLPRPGAPDFVKGSLSFKVEDAIKFLQDNSSNGWCNVDLKVSKAGKPYAELNTWKPNNSYSGGSGKPNVNDAYQKKANNSLKNQGFGGGSSPGEDDIPF